MEFRLFFAPQVGKVGRVGRRETDGLRPASTLDPTHNVQPCAGHTLKGNLT